MRTGAAIVAFLTAVAAQDPPAQNPLVLHRHFDSGTARYQYVPFEVSSTAAALTISYSFSGDDGSSVVDLGLYYIWDRYAFNLKIGNVFDKRYYESTGQTAQVQVAAGAPRNVTLSMRVHF